MRGSIRICILLLFILASNPIEARNFYRFSNVTRTDGLSSDFIRDITQDSLGFMWFATNNGLCRFDGYSIISFRENGDKNTGLYSNSIICVYADKSGNVWVGSMNGTLSRYDFGKARFYHYHIAHTSEIDMGAQVNCLIETPRHNLLVGTTDGLYVFDRRTQQKSKIDLGSSAPKISHITSLCIDTDGSIIVGTLLHGILLLSGDLKHISTIKAIPERKKNGERIAISALFVDNKARLWASSDNDGLYILSERKSIISHLPFSTPLHETVQDEAGNIWVCTVNNGLLFFDARGHNLHPEQILPSTPYSGLTALSFQSAFRSNDGTVWFGSHGSGIQFCNPSDAVYLHVKPDDAGLSYRTVTSFFEQNDRSLWVGTDGGGIAILDSNLQKRSSLNDRQGLPSNAILCMRSKGQSLWTSMWGGGIAEISLATNKVLRTFSSKSNGQYSLPNDNIKWIEPGNELMWLADNGRGVIAFDPQSKRFYHSGNEGYRQLPLRRPEYASKCIISADGSVWIASVMGIFRIKNTMKRYDYIEKDSTSPSGSYTQALFEDHQHRIWIASDKGVDYWSPNDDCFHRLATRYPVFSVGAVVIEQDSLHRYWIGNANGLFCLDVSKNELITFALPEGFNFTQHASLRLRNGQLAFGGNDGFLIVNPMRATAEKPAPKVRFTGFSLFYTPQRKVLQDDDSLLIDVANHISLSHTQTVFGCEFAALDFKSEHATQYWYRLEGFDSTWRLVGKQRMVTFTNLDPGNYRLCVRASNKGLTSESSVLGIRIAPPWWQTWWFRALFAAIIVIVGIGIFRWRSFQIRRQNKILEHKVRLRTEELHRANAQLQAKTEEIEIQNKQLNELTINLQHNNTELSHKNEELAALTDELRWQKEALIATNKSLETTNATKDTLFSIIGHDLRNAFHSIQGSAQLLYQSYQQMSEEKRLRMLANIEKASSGVFGTFTNLFDWARSQTNRISFVPELVEMADLIHETVNANQYLADDKHIKVLCDVTDSGIAFVDRKMMATVLRNLFTNAIKFTRSNGVITITARLIEPMVEIKVSDTGIGMDEDTLTRLFELKATRSTAGTNNETGTGLGLIICREFIERNGGTIQVESQQNKGSSFIVRLPQGQIKTDVAKKQLTTSPQSQNAKILIAEDDDVIRYNLVHLLETEGYEVLQAPNGKVAFELCQSFLPHLIISDITMPEMDGYELCRTIRHTPLTEKTPVLLLTANLAASSQLESYKCGADAFLEKPFDSALLLVRIANLLRRKPTNAVQVHSNNDSLKDIKPADAKLIERMQELLYQNIADAEYSVERLADDLGMSRTHLYRKIKQLHGISPSEYQQNLRLQASAEILKNSSMRISEVAYAVGYSDPHYFSTSFVRYFKLTPSEYQRQWRN